MKKIIVAVGSTRRPKLNAVWEALTVFGPSIDSEAQFDVAGVEVESGVTHTPLSRNEIMAGAWMRAKQLVRMKEERGEPWAFFVGLEGGLDVLDNDPPKTVEMRPQARDAVVELHPDSECARRHVFLENWAYVTDGKRGAFGQSGAILIPEPLARRVVDEGVELAQAIDDFAGGRGIRDAQGAWGVLTRNMITRQDAFRVAVINAFAPFYNAAIYGA